LPNLTAGWGHKLEEDKNGVSRMDDIAIEELFLLISKLEGVSSDQQSRIRILETRLLVFEGRENLHKSVDLFLSSHPEYAENLNERIINYCDKLSKEKKNMAGEDYESFVRKYPDAAVHKGSLANLLDADANLSLHDAYSSLKQYFKEKTFNWSEPIDSINNNFSQNINEKLLKDYSDLVDVENDELRPEDWYKELERTEYLSETQKGYEAEAYEEAEARNEYEADAREEHQSLLQEAARNDEEGWPYDDEDPEYR
jgi:hypothetical protein